MKFTRHKIKERNVCIMADRMFVAWQRTFEKFFGTLPVADKYRRLVANEMNEEKAPGFFAEGENADKTAQTHLTALYRLNVMTAEWHEIVPSVRASIITLVNRRIAEVYAQLKQDGEVAIRNEQFRSR